MIDRDARDSIAEATRHYLTGLSSNFTFNDTIFDLKSRDPAIRAIRDQLWLIYDDLQEHRHEGRWKLSAGQRGIVLRIILFLKSDLEYQWPRVPGWYLGTRPLIWLFTLSLGSRALDKLFENRDTQDVWPFRSQNEIEEAKGEPKYLAFGP